jgi:hypothetical protein
MGVNVINIFLITSTSVIHGKILKPSLEFESKVGKAFVSGAFLCGTYYAKIEAGTNTLAFLSEAFTIKIFNVL